METRTTTQNTAAQTLGWRDAAINEALRGFNNAEQRDALLREIRLARPEGATLTLWPARARLLAFLRGHTQNLRSLLAGSDASFAHGQAETRPLSGWYAFSWQGAELELALPPATGDHEGMVLLGADAEDLARFARALAAHSERPAGRALRYSQGWEDAPELDAELGRVTWDDIVLPPALLSGVRDAVEGFAAHREAFRAFGFAWKRGILLIGPPGTGKTMIGKAVGAALPEWPFLYVRDLELGYDREEAMKAIWTRARSLSPCVLVFEDMDGLVGDSNRTVFLNELDGFGSNEGLLVVASSNHPGKIDEALLKRPSRFDRVFAIGLPALAERAEFCRRLLARPQLAARLTPDLDAAGLCVKVAAGTEGFTPAYLKEAFLSAALSRAQAGVQELDAAFADAVLFQVDELKAHLKRMKNPDALADMDSDAPLGFRA